MCEMNIVLISIVVAGHAPVWEWREPMIGKLGGIQVSFDRVSQAERLFGPASTSVGAHPNGGRFWLRSRREISADCWHFDKQGYFIDDLTIANWTGSLSEIGSSGSVYRGIRFMTRDTDLFKLLKKRDVPVRWSKAALILQAKYRVPQSMRRHSWQHETIEYIAEFRFKSHRLVAVNLTSSYFGAD
jgi:hypothetical protein